MGVTIEYVLLNIGFQTVIALLLASLMQRLTQSTLLRGALLLPWLISNVIAAMLWFWLLDYQIGLVNYFIEAIGLPKVAFFGDEAWAIPTIAFVNVWRHMGYTALLIFAGMQTIPKYVYEAASIDGSSEWSSFWRITLPLIRPVLAMILVITVTGSFQVFDTVAVTTRGGPVNVTRVMQYYIYQKAFGEGQFGYASALSVVLFAHPRHRRRLSSCACSAPANPTSRRRSMAMTTIELRAAQRHRKQRRRNRSPGRIAAWVVLIVFLILSDLPVPTG